MNMTYRNRGRIRKFKSKFEQKIHGELAKVGVESNYEAEKIGYTIEYKYSPDFPVMKKNGELMYLEAKGIFEYEDRRKHVAISKQHPEHDIRFIFYSDYKLNKNAKMRYSGWCDKHGFKYCIQTIPKEWLEELEYYNEKEPDNE
jgi:hypothetical protein